MIISLFKRRQAVTGGRIQERRRFVSITDESAAFEKCSPPQCAHWGTPLASAGGKASIPLLCV